MPHKEMEHIQHYRLEEKNVSAMSSGEFCVFRVNGGADLMQNIKSVALDNGITSGMVLMLVGTIQKARIAWYNSEKQEFEVVEYDEGLELTSGSGSLGMENETLTPHIHITLANKEKAFGGHLFDGTIVKEYVEGTMIKLDDVFVRRLFVEKLQASPLHFQKM